MHFLSVAALIGLTIFFMVTSVPTEGKSAVPRPEYPRPQFVRDTWMNLNGEWQFEIDSGDIGLEKGLLEKEYPKKIVVPFCPESTLSGIGNVDFMKAVWYRRKVDIPAKWSRKRLLLHFQAVDYDATVWVNGKEAGRHRGGFTPFTLDITDLAKPGESATIVLRARDDNKPPQPRGKQSQQFENQGCVYTRTTGIWQTVWLEPVPMTYLKRPKITPDLGNSCFRVEQRLSRPLHNGRVKITLKDRKGEVAVGEAQTGSDFSPIVTLAVPEARKRLWKPSDPFLYDLEIELIGSDGRVIDSARSYAGLRSVTIDGMAVKINGKPIFQRLVLDQGYYPDGIMTAPTDEALVRDIEISLLAGFNGARLHQKVFEERFLYHADRLGYLVWGEFADWGCRGYGPNNDHLKPGATYITQWLEAMERDYSHPSIIGWCPLNEMWQDSNDRTTIYDEVILGLFLATKAMDGTRPVLDTSGWNHKVPEADIYDSHDYDQDPTSFKERFAGVVEGKPYINMPEVNTSYRGQPYFVSEFGGIWWNREAAKNEDSWGYGERPKSIEEFYTRFDGLCGVLLDNPAMFGYCYTQLTDVFQEQNGIYKFDRSTKFDMERIRKVQTRKAAIEKG